MPGQGVRGAESLQLVHVVDHLELRRDSNRLSSRIGRSSETEQRGIIDVPVPVDVSDRRLGNSNRDLGGRRG